MEGLGQFITLFFAFFLLLLIYYSMGLIQKYLIKPTKIMISKKSFLNNGKNFSALNNFQKREVIYCIFNMFFLQLIVLVCLFVGFYFSRSFIWAGLFFLAWVYLILVTTNFLRRKEWDSLFQYVYHAPEWS